FLAVEYAGIALAGALDSQATKPAPASSNAMSVSALATTSPLDVVVGVFADTAGTGVMTAGSGFAARTLDDQFYSLIEDDLPGTLPASVAPGAALPVGTSDNCWVAAAASFRAQ